MIVSSPKALAALVLQKRGSIGVRATAQAIGISASSLTRIEKGRKVDVETTRKVCAWLDATRVNMLQIAFKNRTPMPAPTASALAALIECATRQFASRNVRSAA